MSIKSYQLFDSLNLTGTLIPKLREISFSKARRQQGAINYIPARQAKRGIIQSGLYLVTGEKVVVEVILRLDDKELAKFEVTGAKNDIAEKLLQAIISAAKSNSPTVL
jgi:hypothetical protein